MTSAPDQTEPVELDGLRETAARVLGGAEAWLAGGLGRDVVLALVQNALPLTEQPRALPRLQRRSHARVLMAVLLLVDDPAAAEIATRLVEVLREGAPERVLAG